MINTLLGRNKYIGNRTFTYFIPSPPARSSGYQEKEIDYLTQKISQIGFDIVDIKVQSNANPNAAGIWIILLLGAKTTLAFEHPLKFTFSESGLKEEEEIELDMSIVHDQI